MNTIILAMHDYLCKHQQGPEAVIINIASVAGLIGLYQFPIYTATKHAIVGLTKSWGDDNFYQKTKIRVIAVCPGATLTPITKLTEESILPGEIYQQMDLEQYIWQT